MNRLFYVALALALGTLSMCAIEAAVPGDAVPRDAVTRDAAPCRQCETACGVCCGCPNDYCRKPLTAPPPAPCQWLCDLYCRKPLTAVPPTPCQWCPNDYCRQPLMPVPHNCEPWYRCVPTSPNLP